MGAIPIISDILEFFQRAIGWIIQILPGPMKIILFIFILINMLGWVTTTYHGMIGYHCTTNDILYKIPTGEVFTNYNLLTSKSRFETSIEKTQNGTIINPFTDYNVNINLLNIHWFPECNNKTIASCTNCSTKYLFPYGVVCDSDGYRKPTYGITNGERDLCLVKGCAPPYGYFYNVSMNRFQCYLNDCQNVSLTFESESINNEIISSGQVVPIPIGMDKFSTGNIVGVSCSNREPRLKIFYTLDIFSVTIWILIITLAIIIYISKYISK